MVPLTSGFWAWRYTGCPRLAWDTGLSWNLFWEWGGTVSLKTGRHFVLTCFKIPFVDRGEIAQHEDDLENDWPDQWGFGCDANPILWGIFFAAAGCSQGIAVAINKDKLGAFLPCTSASAPSGGEYKIFETAASTQRSGRASL